MASRYHNTTWIRTNTTHWHRHRDRYRGCIYKSKLDTQIGYTYSTQQADRTTQALIRLPRVVYIPQLYATLFFSPLPLKGELDLNSGAWSSFSFKTIVSNKVEECTWYAKGTKGRCFGVLQSWILKRQADKDERWKKRKRRHMKISQWSLT